MRNNPDGPPVPVRILEYDMSEFMTSCVQSYLSLTGLDKLPKPLREAKTPFLVATPAALIP